MKKLKLTCSLLTMLVAAIFVQSCNKIEDVVPANSIEKQSNVVGNTSLLAIETISGFVKQGFKNGPLKTAEFSVLTALDICKNGEIFTGSLDGIRKITKTDVSSVDFAALPENYEILNLLIDENDDIYINTYDRILKITNGKVTNFDPDLYDIYGLCRGADGYFYASGYSTKANKYLKRRYRANGTYNDLPIDLGRIQAVTKDGIIYYNFDSKIYKYTTTGGSIIFAGGTRGYADEKGNAAQFNGVEAMALDENGNLYAADKNNYRIRKITSDGTVTTIAGNGEQQNPSDYSDNKDQLGDVSDLAYCKGYLYITEIQPSRVRRIKVN